MRLRLMCPTRRIVTAASLVGGGNGVCGAATRGAGVRGAALTSACAAGVIGNGLGKFPSVVGRHPSLIAVISEARADNFETPAAVSYLRTILESFAQWPSLSKSDSVHTPCVLSCWPTVINICLSKSRSIASKLQEYLMNPSLRRILTLHLYCLQRHACR